MIQLKRKNKRINRERIKTLPRKAVRFGYPYTKILQTDQFYIYLIEVESEPFYEVFVRKLQCHRTKHYSREMFPGYDAFGKYAWSFSSIEEAINKFLELIAWYS